MTVTADATKKNQTYTYRVRMKDDKIETGEVSHTSRQGVIASLARNPDVQTVLRVSNPTAGGVGKKARPKVRSLVAASRQLELCLINGLDERESIDAIRAGGELDDVVLDYGLREVSRDMGKGLSMPAAMSRHPYIFPPLMVQTLKAGDEGGFLKDAAAQAADDLEAEDNLRAKVKKAMTYPLVILGVTSAIFIFLMLVVVPKFADLYDELSNGQAQLPALTQMVVHLSTMMVWGVPALGIAGAAAFLYYRRNAHEEHVRAFLDPLKLKAPVFGKLFRLIALTRFCRVMTALSRNGVHPIDALQITATAVGNIVMERAIREAAEAKAQGESIAEALGKHDVFPKLLINFVSIGEETGDPSTSLASVGRLYDRDVDEITNRMEALIQPFFLVTIAVMIGIVAVAIYLPYFSLGDIVSPY